MKKQIVLFLALLILLPQVYSKSPGSSASEKKKARKTELFNGRNLDGWYTFIKGRGKNNDPNGVFTVQKGLIRISGEEFGCITTNDEFENYKITVIFRWGGITHAPRVDKARDSGLLLHSVGEDGGSAGTWMHSIECQIIEGGTGDFIVVGDGSDNFSITCPVADAKQGNSYVFQPGGKKVTVSEGRINWAGRDEGWKDVKGFRGAKDVEKPVGEWNRLECVVKDGGISNYLNGVLINQAFEVKPNRGKIQVQSEGAEIFIRKIAVNPL